MIDTGLNTKIGSKNTYKTTVFNFVDVPEGAYEAKLVVVYPWKTLTRDSKIAVRTDDNKVVKDDSGAVIKVDAPNLTWSTVDMVFEITSGDFVGSHVKGSLSTHPDLIGSANRFLYNARLFDVELANLRDHLGVPVKVNVKHRVDNYKDKITGEDISKLNVYVSYYSRAEEAKEDLGI